jgi:hypothetical protein
VTGTGVRDPEAPDRWLVAPWPTGASFDDVFDHFQQTSLTLLSSDDSTVRLLAFHEGFSVALAAAPTHECTNQVHRDWRDDMQEVADRAVGLFRKLHVAQYGRDPQADEDHHVQAVKQRTSTRAPGP